jgi:hypothetical protein
MPGKEGVDRSHGRSAQLQALPEVDGSVRQEQEEGASSALFLFVQAAGEDMLGKVQELVYTRDDYSLLIFDWWLSRRERIDCQ